MSKFKFGTLLVKKNIKLFLKSIIKELWVTFNFQKKRQIIIVKKGALLVYDITNAKSLEKA